MSGIHHTITARLVAAIEAGAGEWRMPWHHGGSTLRPSNVLSGRAYQGINTLVLWADASAKGYGSAVWGTYRQWQQLGCQVRKGMKAAPVVFYGQKEQEGDCPQWFARTNAVFNADQVEGYEAPPPVTVDTLPDVEAFVAQTGASLAHGGDRACYVPKTDQILMPEREKFKGTEAYYATLMHELTHWTGIESRCNRDMMGRFGSDAYAMEELVAELGASFLCADLGISTEPRPDHAQYLDHWLRVMRSDVKAIFTAASKATQAAKYLQGEREVVS